MKYIAMGVKGATFIIRNRKKLIHFYKDAIHGDFKALLNHATGLLSGPNLKVFIKKIITKFKIKLSPAVLSVTTKSIDMITKAPEMIPNFIQFIIALKKGAFVEAVQIFKKAFGKEKLIQWTKKFGTKIG